MTAVTVTRRLPASIAPLAVGAVAVAGCAFVAANNPSQSTLGICPFKQVTGLPCPGCGATRAAYQLMHGNLNAAIQFNALAVFVIFPLMLGAYLAWAIPKFGGPQFIKLRMPNWLAWSLLGVLAVWWVVRLLPFDPFIQLRV